MKYLFLLYVDESRMEPGLYPSDIDEHIAFTRDAISRGSYVSCDALAPPATATTLRMRDGKTLISDGPFAETREVLGAFYILDCADLDEALAMAEHLPQASHGAIEIRAIADVPGWDEAIGLSGRDR
ncbi:hypothetical protein AYO38_05805 [bacterium SCGC AG-212-C10]|nr:hypothetical protein AYO38_05805 [bacterium SCGC AG-212-C10]